MFFFKGGIILQKKFSRNMLLLNFFEVISGQKNLKNHVKIRLFKRRFEIKIKISYFKTNIFPNKTQNKVIFLIYSNRHALN